jgi:hypothetical protein
MTSGIRRAEIIFHGHYFGINLESVALQGVARASGWHVGREAGRAYRKAFSREWEDAAGDFLRAKGANAVITSLFRGDKGNISGHPVLQVVRTAQELEIPVALLTQRKKVGVHVDLSNGDLLLQTSRLREVEIVRELSSWLGGITESR